MNTFALPKTQQLVVFQEVIRSGSIGSAAKELGLTQPAVSKIINDIEAYFGVELVVRKNTGVTLSQRAGNAEPLLLTTRKTQSAFIKPVLDFIPDCRLTQSLLHHIIQLSFAFDAMCSRSESNIIIHTHRKRIRLLKNHAHTFTQQINIVIGINVIIVQQNPACNTAAFDKIVHSIQRFQQC